MPASVSFGLRAAARARLSAELVLNFSGPVAPVGVGARYDRPAPTLAGYDALYKQLIADMDLERVTGVFSMETIFEGRPLSPA